jgi:hypothetical protein
MGNPLQVQGPTTPDGNKEATDLVGSVVIEEMLHMTIACNVLNAVGGHPAINSPRFLPKYPSGVPGGVDGGLVVGLEKFSQQLVLNTFMAFEQPENPDVIDGDDHEPPPGEVTIGTFYQNIIDGINYLEQQGVAVFTGDPSLQVTTPYFSSEVLFPIRNATDATNAINVIVDQGEGTQQDPMVVPQDEDGEVDVPAHYYRFQEIIEGKRLVQDPTTKQYTFTGAPIVVNYDQVCNMIPNPSAAMFRNQVHASDADAYKTIVLFNYTYTNLLNCLHETFNGMPNSINAALGLMNSLRLSALKLLQIPVSLIGPDGTVITGVAGPSFEYTTSDMLVR